MVAFDDGSFIVVWSSFDYQTSQPSSSIQAQKFSDTGTAVGTPFDLVPSVSDGQGGSIAKNDPSVVSLARGGFAVAYENQFHGSVVIVEKFDSDGAAISHSAGLYAYLDVPNRLNHGYIPSPDIAELPDGTLVVSWVDRIGIAQFATQYAQLLNPDLTNKSDVFQVSASADPRDGIGSVLALDNGAFWTALRVFDTRTKGQDIAGDGDANSLLGTILYDTLTGNAGNDALFGMDGADVLFG